MLFTTKIVMLRIQDSSGKRMVVMTSVRPKTECNWTSVLIVLSSRPCSSGIFATSEVIALRGHIFMTSHFSEIDYLLINGFKSL